MLPNLATLPSTNQTTLGAPVRIFDEYANHRTTSGSTRREVQGALFPPLIRNSLLLVQLSTNHTPTAALSHRSDRRDGMMISGRALANPFRSTLLSSATFFDLFFVRRKTNNLAVEICTAISHSTLLMRYGVRILR